MARFTEEVKGFGRQHPGEDAAIIADHPLAANLNACYLFNSAPANTVPDLTGRFPLSKVGTSIGRGQGNFNNYGLKFFGTASTYYDIGAAIGAILDGNVNFSMSCWVKLATAGASHTILNDVTTASQNNFDGFWIGYLNGVGFSIQGSDGAHSNAGLTINEIAVANRWYHLACTSYDSANRRAKIWLDGGRLSVSGQFVRVLAQGSNWRIGQTTSSLSTPLNGNLDHLYIWLNKQLTDRDARSLYEEPFSFLKVSAPDRRRLLATGIFPRSLSITDTINLKQSIPVRIDDRRLEKRRVLYQPRAKKTQVDTLVVTDSVAIELDLSITKIDSLAFQNLLPVVIDDRRLELRHFVFVRQRTDHPTTDNISFVSTPSYTSVFNFSPIDTLSLSDNIGGNVFNESVTQSLGLYDRSTLRKVVGQVIKRVELNRAELGSEVNWQDPITDGLLFCALLNEGAGPAHNIAFDNFQGPPNSVWEVIGYRDAQAWNEDARLNLSKEVTLLAQTFWNGAVSTINIAKKAPNTGATGGYTLRMNGIQPRFGVFSGGLLTAIDGPSITKGSYTFAGTYDNNRISIYANGKQTLTSVVGVSKMAAPTGFGTLIGDATFKLNCTLVMIWNRALSRAELADIGVNPLRLIRRPTKKRVIVSEEIYSDTLDVVNQLTFGQSATEGYIFSRAPTDTLALTHVPAILNLHRYVVDAINFGDLLYPGSIWRRAVIDALSLSDYAIDSSHYYFVSSLNFSEVVKRGGVNYRAVSQKLILTQDINSPLWAIAHEIVFKERVTTAKVINVSLSDTMAFRDDPPKEHPESMSDILPLDQNTYLDAFRIEPALIDEVSFVSKVTVGRVSKYNLSQTIGFGSYTSFYVLSCS